MQPSFEWTDALWIFVFVVVVALFVGPGMWSSSTNTLAKDLWLSWKQKKRSKTSDGKEPPAKPENDGTPSSPRTK